VKKVEHSAKKRDLTLRCRMTDDLLTRLDRAISEIQQQVPEGRVSMSSIGRHAVEQFLSQHEAKRNSDGGA